MKYAESIRQMFPTLDPVVGDLFLLEPHQIANLPDRAPPTELAAVLRANPQLKDYLVARHPPIAGYVEGLIADQPAGVDADLAASEQELLWEVGDLICYQKAPQLYDERAPGQDFDRSSISDVAAVEGIRVIDAGAGTGLVSFMLAEHARHVFAVEPVASLRAFMRSKASRLGIDQLYVVDGTLDAIPLPDDSADVLVTCRAIGWHLDDELHEIERVLVSGGAAVHLTGVPDEAWTHEEWHRAFIEADYVADTYRLGTDRARRYRKRIS